MCIVTKVAEAFVLVTSVPFIRCLIWVRVYGSSTHLLFAKEAVYSFFLKRDKRGFRGN